MRGRALLSHYFQAQWEYKISWYIQKAVIMLSSTFCDSNSARRKVVRSDLRFSPTGVENVLLMKDNWYRRYMYQILSTFYCQLYKLMKVWKSGNALQKIERWFFSENYICYSLAQNNKNGLGAILFHPPSRGCKTVTSFEGSNSRMTRKRSILLV